MAKKNIIRLTESDLRSMIMASVKSIINEESKYFRDNDENTEEMRLEILDKVGMILHGMGSNISDPDERGRTSVTLFSDETGRQFKVPVEWEVGDDPQCIAYCSFWFILPQEDWKRDTVEDFVQSLPSYIEQNFGMECNIEDMGFSDEIEITVNLFK